MKGRIQKILIPLFLLCLYPNIIVAAELLYEDFNLCETPDGWTLENLAGSCSWLFNSNRQNETGGEGCYAIADSDNCADQPMDTTLSISSIDCSTSSGTKLFFNYDALHSIGNTSFTVQLSVNGGTEWVDIWHRTESDLGPKTASVDISAVADGQSSVLLRFHYYTDKSDFWWQVDDVRVSADEKNTFNGIPFLQAPDSLFLLAG
ncbi:hypothetical protein [Candidatus Electrothrix sp.]|uniref:hypothetical protein n=1 Tax=Candidatus Electrothrix sp. TaxID=2170559 RepID=UPI004055A003